MKLFFIHWKWTPSQLGRVENVYQGWLMYVSQAAFSFIEQQIIKVTPFSWFVTDPPHFFFFLILWELFVTQNYIIIYLLFMDPYFLYPGIVEVRATAPHLRSHSNFFLSHKELKKRKLKLTEGKKYNIAREDQGGLGAAQGHNCWLFPSLLHLLAHDWLWKCHWKGVIKFYRWWVRSGVSADPLLQRHWGHVEMLQQQERTPGGAAMWPWSLHAALIQIVCEAKWLLCVTMQVGWSYCCNGFVLVLYDQWWDFFFSIYVYLEPGQLCHCVSAMFSVQISYVRKILQL